MNNNGLNYRVLLNGRGYPFNTISEAEDFKRQYGGVVFYRECICRYDGQ